jgi:hypothetical protein
LGGFFIDTGLGEAAGCVSIFWGFLGTSWVLFEGKPLKFPRHFEPEKLTYKPT